MQDQAKSEWAVGAPPRTSDEIRRPDGDVLSLANLPRWRAQAGRVFRAYGWAGVAVAGLIIGLAVVSASRLTTDYTARVPLLIESTVGKVLNPDSVPQIHPDFYENQLRNHLSVMESRAYRDYFAAALPDPLADAVQRPYLKPGQAPSAPFLREVIERGVKVERERGRELFVVSVRHRQSDVALDLAERFARGYLTYRQEEYRQASRIALNSLQTSAEEMTAEVNQLEKRHREFRQNLEAVVLRGGSHSATESLQQANAAAATAHLDVVRLSVQARRARDDLASSDLPFDNALLTRFGNTRELRTRYERARSDLAVMGEHYGPRHPKRIEAEASVAQLRLALVENFKLGLGELDSQLAMAEATERRLQEEQRAAFERSLEADRLEAESTALVSVIEAKRAALTELNRRIEQSRVRAELQADVMHLIDSASLVKPLLSRKIGLIAAGCVAGGLALLVVPWILFTVDPRLKTDVDLERVLGREVFGVVPRLRGLPEAERACLVSGNHHPAGTEAFMTIAGQLSARVTQTQGLRILVTSTVPGEGKSLVASNLAAAFARFGRSTLIVDLDLRRPSQHRYHPQLHEGGVLPALRADEADGSEIPASWGLLRLAERLHLMPAGGEDAQPSARWLGTRLEAMLAKLEQQFDVIVLDTSPAGIFSDAVLLARHANATLLVARHNFAPLAKVVRTVRDFEHTPAPVMGVIVNGALASHRQPGLTYQQLDEKYARHYGLNKTRWSRPYLQAETAG